MEILRDYGGRHQSETIPLLDISSDDVFLPTDKRQLSDEDDFQSFQRRQLEYEREIQKSAGKGMNFSSNEKSLAEGFESSLELSRAEVVSPLSPKETSSADILPPVTPIEIPRRMISPYSPSPGRAELSSLSEGTTSSPNKSSSLGKQNNKFKIIQNESQNVIFVQ